MRKLILSLAVLVGGVAMDRGAQAAPVISAVQQLERPTLVQTVAYRHHYHRRYHRRHYYRR